MKPSRVLCTLDPLLPLKKYRTPCFYTGFTEVLNCFSLKTCIVLQILLYTKCIMICRVLTLCVFNAFSA